jgi:hypothetical protein
MHAGQKWQVGKQLYIFPSCCSRYPETRRNVRRRVTATVFGPTLLSKLSHGKKKNIKGTSFLALGSTVLFLSLRSIYSGTTTVGIYHIDIKYERVSCYACFFLDFLRPVPTYCAPFVCMSSLLSCTAIFAKNQNPNRRRRSKPVQHSSY